MQKLVFYSFRFFIFLFWLMPFWCLYAFSDFLYFVMYYIVKYRKKIVFQNLRKSFPEYDNAQIERIAKAYYTNFCDVTVEAIKGISMTAKDFRERFVIVNPQLSDVYFNRGQNVIYAGAHYCNWEWTIAGCFQFKHLLVGFYKPLSNKYIDKYLRANRAKLGAVVAPISKSKDTFQQAYPRPAGFGLAADQSPSNTSKAHWLKFLNQDTACLFGPEVFAKLHNIPVFYFEIQRTKRGFYQMEISLITDTPNEMAKGEIIDILFKRLEETIRRKPENWLWSHRRWKHTKNEATL